MPDYVVLYKAIADFGDLTRKAAEALAELEAMKKAAQGMGESMSKAFVPVTGAIGDNVRALQAERTAMDNVISTAQRYNREVLWRGATSDTQYLATLQREEQLLRLLNIQKQRGFYSPQADFAFRNQELAQRYLLNRADQQGYSTPDQYLGYLQNVRHAMEAENQAWRDRVAALSSATVATAAYANQVSGSHESAQQLLLGARTAAAAIQNLGTQGANPTLSLDDDQFQADLASDIAALKAFGDMVVSPKADLDDSLFSEKMTAAFSDLSLLDSARAEAHVDVAGVGTALSALATIRAALAALGEAQARVSGGPYVTWEGIRPQPPMTGGSQSGAPPPEATTQFNVNDAQYRTDVRIDSSLADEASRPRTTSFLADIAPLIAGAAEARREIDTIAQNVHVAIIPGVEDIPSSPGPRGGFGFQPSQSVAAAYEAEKAAADAAAAAVAKDAVIEKASNDSVAASALDMAAKVRLAYQLAGGTSRNFINITDLKDQLAAMGVLGDEADKVLESMYRLQQVNLVPQANQQILTQLQRDTAVLVGGESKHKISIMETAAAEDAATAAIVRDSAAQVQAAEPVVSTKKQVAQAAAETAAAERLQAVAAKNSAAAELENARAVLNSAMAEQVLTRAAQVRAAAQAKANADAAAAWDAYRRSEETGMAEMAASEEAGYAAIADAADRAARAQAADAAKIAAAQELAAKALKANDDIYASNDLSNYSTDLLAASAATTDLARSFQDAQAWSFGTSESIARLCTLADQLTASFDRLTAAQLADAAAAKAQLEAQYAQQHEAMIAAGELQASMGAQADFAARQAAIEKMADDERAAAAMAVADAYERQDQAAIKAAVITQMQTDAVLRLNAAEILGAVEDAKKTTGNYGLAFSEVAVAEGLNKATVAQVAYNQAVKDGTHDLGGLKSAAESVIASEAAKGDPSLVIPRGGGSTAGAAAGGGGGGGGWATAGAAAAGGWWGGWWGIFNKQIPLFAGAFGNTPIIGHIGAIALALHGLVDFLITLVPAILTAAAALTAFGLAASDSALIVYQQLVGLHNIHDALSQSIYPLTGNLEALHKAVQPQVFELFGLALVNAGKETALFNKLAIDTGNTLIDMATKADVIVSKSGPQLQNFLRVGAYDLSQFAIIGKSVVGIFAELRGGR